MRSTTSCMRAEGESDKAKVKSVRAANARAKIAARVRLIICLRPLKTSLITSPSFAFLLSPSLERLSEAEVYLAARQTLDGRAAAELREDELRRVEQVSVVSAYRAERRPKAESDADGVRPLLAEVRVAPRLATSGVEEVARAVEDVAAVVEGHGL